MRVAITPKSNFMLLKREISNLYNTRTGIMGITRGLIWPGQWRIQSFWRGEVYGVLYR